MKRRQHTRIDPVKIGLYVTAAILTILTISLLVKLAGG